MLTSFHNTIQANEQLNISFNTAAKSQEDMVLEVFKMQKTPMAWFEVSAFIPDMNTCSLKRCLSNLSTKGFLVKDNDKSKMVTGTQGKSCHKYHLLCEK